MVGFVIPIDMMCSAVNKRIKYSSNLIDASILPQNTFDLKGDTFYTLVRELTSEDVEDLLKMQRIPSARCFLTTNPLTFLNFQTNEPSVIELQARLSYRTVDEKKVVLAGVTADVLYLKELFKLFLLTNAKKTIGCTDSPTTAERLRQSSPKERRLLLRLSLDPERIKYQPMIIERSSTNKSNPGGKIVEQNTMSKITC